MLQLKTIHDARRHRALPSLHAHSTSLLAPRRVDRDGTVSGPGGGGCGMAARLAGRGVRAEAAQGRARPQKVPPPAGAVVEVNVRKEEPLAASAGSGTEVGQPSMDGDGRLGCAARAGQAVPAAPAPPERLSPPVDAPRRRPSRASSSFSAALHGSHEWLTHLIRAGTISHDFELVLPADTTFDGGVGTPALRSPADEDEWEFLSFEHNDTALETSSHDGPGSTSTAASIAPPAPVVAA